jgi:hypothetical protein
LTTQFPTAAACQAAIERALITHGGLSFAYSSGPQGAQVMLFFPGLAATFVLPLPDSGAERFHYTAQRHHKRSAEAALTEWQRECLSVWQVTARLILAKFEAVEAGLTTLVHEFSMYPNPTIAALMAAPQQLEQAEKSPDAS